jgi:predicted transposase/invertase (TIGR01784 family)
MPQQVGHITRLAGFIIFKKYEDFTDPVVKAYMKYFATKNADSRETETINNLGSFFKTDTLTRSKYMTYEFDMYQSRQEGRAEGRAEGKIDGNTEATLRMIDAMFANPKFTDEDITAISGISQDEIAKRRAQRQ